MSTLAFKYASLDVPAGCGQDERLADGDRFDLPAGWRRTLSNFAPVSFELDGIVWPSVEHYFQARKFRDSHPDYYAAFHSGHLIAHTGAEIKRAGRRYKMTAAMTATWNGGLSRETLAVAQRAKFTQSEAARAALVATWPATLVHRASNRSSLVVEHDLMRLRDDLHQ